MAKLPRNQYVGLFGPTTGDRIRLSVSERRLDLLVDADELARRRAKRPVPPPSAERGWSGLFRRHVLQADQGCDLDFLRAERPSERQHQGEAAPP